MTAVHISLTADMESRDELMATGRVLVTQGQYGEQMPPVPVWPCSEDNKTHHSQTSLLQISGTPGSFLSMTDENGPHGLIRNRIPLKQQLLKLGTRNSGEDRILNLGPQLESFDAIRKRRQQSSAEEFKHTWQASHLDPATTVSRLLAGNQS